MTNKNKRINKGIMLDHPYVELGAGTKKLVVFPPLNDALFDAVSLAWFYQWIFRFYSADYKIYVISRKRDLPVGYTTEEIAQDYSDVFKILGPCHLMGVSFGGLVAQQFAYLFPQSVQSLIIVIAAHRMGPQGLDIARRWIPWARKGYWAEIYADMVSLTYTGWHRRFYHTCTPFFVRWLSKNITHATDFIISGQAAMIHDFTEQLPKIPQSVLILGGKNDAFFPKSSFLEMHQRLPGSGLHLFDHAGHGAYEQNQFNMDRLIMKFIEAAELKSQEAGPEILVQSQQPDTQSQDYP